MNDCLIWRFRMNFRSRKLRLLAVILLPLMISAAAMLWSMARSLEAISASVDRQEASRAWSAVQSAVGALEERAGGMILDNARWDDAVDTVYGEADLQQIAAVRRDGQVLNHAHWREQPGASALAAEIVDLT